MQGQTSGGHLSADQTITPLGMAPLGPLTRSRKKNEGGGNRAQRNVKKLFRKAFAAGPGWRQRLRSSGNHSRRKKSNDDGASPLTGARIAQGRGAPRLRRKVDTRLVNETQVSRLRIDKDVSSLSKRDGTTNTWAG